MSIAHTGGIFSSLFVAVDKKGLAHVLDINYEVGKALVCEILCNTISSK